MIPIWGVKESLKALAKVSDRTPLRAHCKCSISSEGACEALPKVHDSLSICKYNAGGGDGPSRGAVGFGVLIEQLAKMVPASSRQSKGSFLFAVDHCFALRGQGTVLTGTVLSGSAQVRMS